MAEETVIAVVADHGEEFLEHGHIQHCRTLFDTSIKVPFVLRVPGAAAGVRRVQARNLDLVPTLLDLLGVPTDGLALEGRSLVPALRSAALSSNRSPRLCPRARSSPARGSCAAPATPATS